MSRKSSEFDAILILIYFEILLVIMLNIYYIGGRP